MQVYKHLHDRLGYLEPDKIEQVHQACKFAHKSHLGQKRESGERYINHPVAAACILADMHFDYQSIMVALLHDVVEDTHITKEEIAEKFGVTVAELVDGVTKLAQITISSKDEEHAQNFRKMVLAMSRDIRVILIKLADRLHNMQTVSSLNIVRRIRIAKETLDIYAPIANRLGMYKMSVDLEDLAFATLYPLRSTILKKAIKRVYGKNKRMVDVIRNELGDKFAESALKDVKIIGRTKHVYGVYKKMLNRRTSFNAITDVYAFRIVVDTVEDCYRALGVIHSLYKPFPGKFKDYIAMPKSNGYQSLHTVLFGPYETPVEIQIRTRLMDQTANSGIAAHWLYKMGRDVVDAMYIRTQQWVNNLLEMQQNTSNPSEFFESLKVDLFSDKVYVFTPKGNIMELPHGSTTIDFAYAVHTDVGNTCIAARVNKKYLPLSTKLLSGQTVSIITSQVAKPDPAWLDFVITGKARHCIKQHMKSRKKEELVVLGKQLFKNALKMLHLDFQKISADCINNMLESHGFKNLSDFYESVGAGENLAVIAARQLVAANNIGGKISGKKLVSEDLPFLIHDTRGVAINFATCCHPVLGDKIVGHLKAGHGLDVHIDVCPELKKLKCEEPKKCIPVNWSKEITGRFNAALYIEIADNPGIFADIAGAVSKADADIYDLACGKRLNGYTTMVLNIFVKNLKHLNMVERYIGNIPNVTKIGRARGSYPGRSQKIDFLANEQ